MRDESPSSEPVPADGSVTAGPVPSGIGRGTDAGEDVLDARRDNGSSVLRSLDPEDSETCIRQLGGILSGLTRRFEDLRRDGGRDEGRHGGGSGDHGRGGRRGERR